MGDASERASERYCQRCGRRRGEHDYICPSPCGCSTFGADLPPGAVPTLELVPVAGPLSKLLHIPSNRGCVVLVYGGAGAGKTTLALRLFASPTVVSGEMDAELVRSYAHRLRSDVREVIPATYDELGVPTWAFREPPVALVVDSAQTCGDTLAVLRACIDAGVPVALVSQVTDAGTPRGPQQLEHDVDVIVHVTPNAIDIEKNRFGACAQIPWGATHTEVHPVPFVVDGVSAYRLRAWPHEVPKGSAYADVMRRAESRKARLSLVLPAPPFAVAAAWSQGRWVEPRDWQARKAFAESMGVPYFSPEHR